MEGGAAATVLRWWRCYQMDEDIRLVNALDNNNSDDVMQLNIVTGQTQLVSGYMDMEHSYCVR